MGLGYILIFLISKKLGAEGVGFFQVILQLITVLGMILGLGMNISVLRFVGQFNNPLKESNLHFLYKCILQTILPITLLVGAGIYLSAESMTNWLGKEHSYTIAIKLAGIALPFFTINQISVEFIRGLRKLQVSELVRSVLRPFVMIIGILLLFNKELNKIDVIYLLILGLIINSLLSRITIWKSLKKIPFKPSTFTRRELLNTSYPMMITSLSSILMKALPIFFLDFFMTHIEVGIYSVAFRIASIVSISLVVVNTVSAPKFAELYWTGKIEELQKVVSQSTKLMFWTALSLSGLLIVFGNFFLNIFGEEFKFGYITMIILILGQLINAATGSVGSILNMCGQQKFYRLLNIFTLIVTFLLLFVGRHKLTLELVALILFAKSVILNMVSVIYVKNKLNIRTYI